MPTRSSAALLSTLFVISLALLWIACPKKWRRGSTPVRDPVGLPLRLVTMAVTLIALSVPSGFSLYLRMFGARQSRELPIMKFAVHGSSVQSEKRVTTVETPDYGSFCVSEGLVDPKSVIVEVYSAPISRIRLVEYAGYVRQAS